MSPTPLLRALGLVLLGALSLLPLAAEAKWRPYTWQQVLLPVDRDRLLGWKKSWRLALAQAVAEDAAAVRGEGALLQPDAGLDRSQPPVGAYRCRTIRLGVRKEGEGGPSFASGEPVPCRILEQNGALRLKVQGGVQRPVGRLWPDTATRMVFLGAMEVGDETRALSYGDDPDRDLLGLVERVGDRRWRLVLPRPRWEALMKVIEIVPADAG